MTNVAERKARMTLYAPQVAADPRLAHLVETHGAQGVWETIRRQGKSMSLERRAQGVDPEALEVVTIRSGAGFLVPRDEFWSDTLSDPGMCQLGDQDRQSLGLWVAGNPELLRMPWAVAVVEARVTTDYGLHAVEGLVAGLNTSGWLVISGLIFDIGNAAHRGVLGVGGLILVTMTTGADKIYPAGHHGLCSQIQASDAVITELAPGAHPLRAGFFGRNRLIAALGNGAMIVEAGARSGARNIISWAAELGRVTTAASESVTSSLSVTPHHLVREPVTTLVTSATNVIALPSLLGTQEGLPLRRENRPIGSLSALLRTVRGAVPAGTTLGTTELMVTTGMTMPEVIAAAAEPTELGWLEDIRLGWRLPGG